MLASAAITKLSNAELKQLSVKTDNDAVLGYLNDAVLELHKRFNLWQEEALITQPDADTLSYDLDGVDVNVTIDLSDHILLLIDKVYDPDSSEVSLNDEDDPYGAATPRYNRVEFPEAVADDVYSVIYRGAPIDMTVVGDTILLPPALFEPMYFYVGFRAHVSQKGSKDLENNTHFQRYLDSCNRAEALGLVVQDSLHPHKFCNNVYP